MSTQSCFPFQQFQQAEAREVGSQRKLISDLVQGLSDEDLSAIEEKVQLYMQTHPNASRQEAQQAVWDMMEFSKSGHVRPGEAMENRLEFYENYLMNQSISPPPDAVRGIANHLYKMEKGDYPEDIKNEWRNYTSFQKQELVNFATFLYDEGFYERALLTYFQYLYKYKLLIALTKSGFLV